MKITLDQLQQFGLTDELLGHQGEEKYVLRQQLVKAAENVKSYLHIEENYEIGNEEFDQQFIQKILDRSTSRFQSVPIDDALNKISKYGIPTEMRRSPVNELKRRLSQVFEIKPDGGKQVIVVKLNGASPDVLSDLTGAKASTDFVIGKYHEWSLIDHFTPV